MNWTSIMEQTIAQLIASAIGAIFLTWVIPKILHKKTEIKETKSKSINLFPIAVFITSFFAILSIFGFYYQWEKFAYLAVITIVLVMATSWIYQRQCPNCKSVFENRRTNTEVIKKEQRTYHYRPLTIYYYSDGTEKNRQYDKHEKTRIENIEIRRDYFECSCGHKWWSAPYEVNLNLESRPKPNKVKTQIRNPNGFDAGINQDGF